MWIAITLLAACLQIARTSAQHSLRSVLNTAEAGYVRFFYAFPLALGASSLWLLGPGRLPDTSAKFWLGITAGGIAQICATMALLHSFKLRDFAVGTIYAKTEVLFVGAASAIILSEPLSILGWVGVLVCLIGVAWLAAIGSRTQQRAEPKTVAPQTATPNPTSSPLTSRIDPAALFGVIAAVGFALAAIGIRGASTSLAGGVAERALFTLTAMLGIQTAIQGLAILRSSTSSIGSVISSWRPAIQVALLSLGGSMAWATAMTLQNAAKVRTLGQVEIVLAFAIGVVVHKESHVRAEYLASAVASAGIFLLVIA